MQEAYFKIKSVKPNKKVINYLKTTQKELENFFNAKIKLPDIFILDSRKQIDQLWQKKTEPWMVGWASDNNIFILSPEKFTKESNHKDSENFWRVLKHEYVHIAMRKLYGHDKPKWLNEGLCCYLAKQVKKEPTQKDALKVFDYYQKGDWEIYSISYFWVKLLIEEFGKAKLFRLLKILDSQTSEGQFAKNFYRVYKFRYSKTDFKKILGQKELCPKR